MLSNEFWDRLRRYPKAGYVAGVCAGIAAYYDWNVKLIRIALVLALFFSGFFPMLLIYAVLWYLMTRDDGQPPIDGGRGGGGRSAPDRGPAPPGPDLHQRFARMEDRLRQMEACVASREYELRRELRKLEA